MAVSITKRKTKSGLVRFRAQVRVPGHGHESKTFSRKKAAKDWGRQEEDRLRGLAPGTAHDQTVSDAIARYKSETLPGLKSRRVRKAHLGWWDEQIGHLKLIHVAPVHVADSIRLLSIHQPDEKPRSPATINRYHSSISAVFNQAHKKWHWMPSNPARDVLRGEESKGRVRWLDDDERVALLKSCQMSGWSGLYPLVLLALATGARQGELLGLTWDRVDLKNPDRLFAIDVYPDGMYFKVGKISGIGGLPVGSSGRVLALLSGGIDSPVAAFELAKRGCHVDFFHLSATYSQLRDDATPVVRLAKSLSRFTLRSRLFTAPATSGRFTCVPITAGTVLATHRAAALAAGATAWQRPEKSH